MGSDGIAPIARSMKKTNADGAGLFSIAVAAERSLVSVEHE